MSGTSIVFKKEMKRVFGDRKLLFSLFIFPAIIVIAIYSLMGSMIKNMVTDIEEHESIVTVVNAPEELKELMKTTGYADTAKIEFVDTDTYSEESDKLKNDVLEGDGDLIVYMDENFEELVNEYAGEGDTIPTMKFMYNNTEDYSAQAYSNFTSMVASTYQSALLAKRLGNLELLTVFNFQDELIVKAEKANTEFISMMLPYLIVMLLFAGAMSVGVDAIAGEKERGTLASMLITPVKRSEIVLGKLLALGSLSGLSAVVYSVSMLLALKFMGGSMDSIGESGFGSITLGPVQAIELVLIMLSLVYLFVAIIGTLSILAKDTKVASAYISPCYIVVIVLGMLTMFTSGKEIPLIRYCIPVYGGAIAIKDICGNELANINCAAAIGGTLVLAVVCTFIMVKAFNSEKVMFNA